MTYIDKIRQVIKDNLTDDMTPTDYLIWVAYWVGREDICKMVSDDYTALLAQQRQRAEDCRYYNMAMRVQGNVKYIPHDDYRQDISQSLANDDFVDPAVTPAFPEKEKTEPGCILI